MLDEFQKFIARGNVIDLAVGIIMGAAFTAIVNSLVTDIIMPPVGKVVGGLDFSNYFLALSTEHYDTLQAAKTAGIATINYGMFLNHVVNFMIVSFAVFMMVRQVNRLQKREAAKQAEPVPPRSELLLEEIRDLLRKKE